MEIVLATLPLPAKVDLVSKGSEASKAASTKPNKAPPQGKIVIKKEITSSVVLFFFSLFFLFFLLGTVFVFKVCN